MTFIHLLAKKSKRFSLLFQDEFTGNLTSLCSCGCWKNNSLSEDCQGCVFGLAGSEEMSNYKAYFQTIEEAKTAYLMVLESGLAMGQRAYLIDSKNSSLRPLDSSSDEVFVHGILPEEAAQFIFDSHLIT
jgi:hypothetical protein